MKLVKKSSKISRTVRRRRQWLDLAVGADDLDTELIALVANRLRILYIFPRALDDASVEYEHSFDG